MPRTSCKPAGNYSSFNVQSETRRYPDIKRAFTVESGKTTELGDVLIS